MKPPAFSRRNWALTLLLPLVGWPGPARADDPPPAPAKPDPVVAELVAAHNRERAENKKPPLTLNPQLEEAAVRHANDMADHETMSHEGSDKSTPAQRVEKAGYVYRSTGENVAWGQPDVPTVMRGWMDSPHHKDNILGDFTEIGAARATAANGAYYWSVSFGRPPTRLDPAEAAPALVKALNLARVAANRPEFQVDRTLAEKAQAVAAAQTKARDAGKTPPAASFEGIDAKPYKSLALSQLSGSPTAEEASKFLLDSPDHKKALLGDPTRIGVGYSCAKDGTPSWCLILAVPAK